jgi:hypothetical protein
LKFFVSGDSGFGLLKFIDDLKVRISFNRFTGDNIISAIFPAINKDSEGNYEAVIDVKGLSGGKAITKFISIESEKMGYFLYGLSFIVVLIVVLIFALRK